MIMRLIRRYALNRDVKERHEEVLEAIAGEKERRANALEQIAEVTDGDEADIRARASNNRREAQQLRQRLADDVGFDVMGGD